MPTPVVLAGSSLVSAAVTSSSVISSSWKELVSSGEVGYCAVRFTIPVTLAKWLLHWLAMLLGLSKACQDPLPFLCYEMKSRPCLSNACWMIARANPSSDFASLVSQCGSGMHDYLRHAGSRPGVFTQMAVPTFQMPQVMVCGNRQQLHIQALGYQQKLSMLVVFLA